jgi:hypothetical protein
MGSAKNGSIKLRLSAVESGAGSTSIRVSGESRTVWGALSGTAARVCACAAGTLAINKPISRQDALRGMENVGMEVSLLKTDCGFVNYCRESGTSAHGFLISALLDIAKQRK